LTVNTKNDIARIQDFVHSNDTIVDYIIKTLGERMQLQTEEEREILWDHIMNNFDYMVEYTEETTQMKVTIDMDYDITDAVVKTELKWHREFCKNRTASHQKEKET
jgi:hypothetical protein